MTNPKVYMDITSEDEPVGRVIIKLFADTMPLTAEYFRTLCTGRRPHYKGSLVSAMYLEHSLIIIPTIQTSIRICFPISENNLVPHQNNIKKHDKAGTVLILNLSIQPGCVFSICTCAVPCNDIEFVVVGQVVEGLDVFNTVARISLDARRSRFMIADCGEILSFQVRSSGEYDKFAPLIDEQHEDIDNLKLELKKLLDKEANLQSLLTIKADTFGQEEEFKKIISEMQTKITNTKKKILLLKAVPSLSDEGVVAVERLIEKLHIDSPQSSSSD